MAMQPAVWTGMYWPMNTCDSLRALHSCGWEWFELSTEHLQQIEEDTDRQARIAEILRTLDDLGLAMPQAHAYLPADVAHPDESVRAADMARLRRELAVCAALDVKNVVIHPGTGGGYTTAEEFRRIRDLNGENLTRLADHAQALGLRIGIENMMDDRRRGRRHFGARPEDLLDLLGGLGHPALGITIDTSHANVQKLDCAGLIRQFGPHLCCTHISDNDGSGDQHRTPGNGTIEWPAAVTAFRDIEYTGIFNLEIPGELEPTPPPDVLAARTREALAVTQRLLSR